MRITPFATAWAAAHLGVVASAATVTTDDGLGADAFVLEFHSGSNYGAAPTVDIKNAAEPSFSRKAYLRFDIAAHPDPISGTTLRLVVGDGGGNGGPPVTGAQVFRVWGLGDVSAGVAGDDAPTGLGWAEGDGLEEAPSSIGITWANAPANSASNDELTTDATELGQFTIEGTGTPGDLITFSSDAMDDWLNADTNGLVTIVVSRQTFDPDWEGWVHEFASREHPTLAPPTLDLGGGCPEDLDGNGAVNSADLNILLSDFGCIGACQGDINADGATDSADLNLLLAAFGSGC